MTPLAATYTTTRRALHAVAEQILASARYAAVGRLGLRVVPGGFATPGFDGRELLVLGDELVVRDEVSGDERRARLTTLRALGALAEHPPGPPPASVYPPATTLGPDELLDVDPAAAALLADWLALVDDALARFRAAHAGEDPTGATLWPEHFDVALSMGEVNYGGSPGDDDRHAEPYLYVGPWVKRRGPFWNEPFGASRSIRDVGTSDDAVAFFEHGWALCRSPD